MMASFLKKGAVRAGILSGVDSLFRYVNRDKLLVVMYHGVTASQEASPVWTQLPVAQFRRQLQFLSRHYRMVSLSEVVAALRGDRDLPQRAALITFDDGLKNNYTAAFPVLRELGVPAVVYLTVDLIGSPEMLWVDELYLLLREAAARGIVLGLGDIPQRQFEQGRIWTCYHHLVETLKGSGTVPRGEEMNRLRTLVTGGVPAGHDDFRLLDWDEVRAMRRSGLVEFGVHTATHRILSELGEEEWHREMVAPKHTLERELGSEAASFCFPNGRPRLDFRPEHLGYLRQAGYVCAFSTENALFDARRGDPMSIGRIPAGNDCTSESDYFRLNTSGAIQTLKKLIKPS